MKKIKLFTDGACSGNPGAGGWGVIIIENDTIKKIKGHENNTTNNRMELKAAIEGIKSSLENSEITLFTDSKYVKDGITEWIHNWKKTNWITSTKKPVKNRDLWEELDNLNNKCNIHWKWVKAHQSVTNEESKYNDMADMLAKEATEIL
tara:strand:- start:3514 stop:3960 length:447 start_codon:yes stop_codon:yes gene_type:complete